MNFIEVVCKCKRNLCLWCVQYKGYGDVFAERVAWSPSNPWNFTDCNLTNRPFKKTVFRILLSRDKLAKVE